jgi:hypothetical protein
VTIFFWTLFTLLLFFVLSTFWRWTIAISGKINHEKNQLDYSYCGILGSTKLGVGIKKNRKNFFFFLKKKNKEIVSFKLKNRANSKKRFSNQKKIRGKNIPHYIFAVYRSINLNNLDINGDLGLINPATTGKIWGGLVAIKNSLLPDNYNININPKFNENVFHIQGTTKINFCPVVLAWRLGKVYFGFKL